MSKAPKPPGGLPSVSSEGAAQTKTRKTKEEREQESDAKAAPRMMKVSKAMAEDVRTRLKKAEQTLQRKVDKQEFMEACYDPAGGDAYIDAQLKAAYTPPWKAQTNPSVGELIRRTVTHLRFPAIKPGAGENDKAERRLPDVVLRGQATESLSLLIGLAFFDLTRIPKGYLLADSAVTDYGRHPEKKTNPIGYFLSHCVLRDPNATLELAKTAGLREALNKMHFDLPLLNSPTTCLVRHWNSTAFITPRCAVRTKSVPSLSVDSGNCGASWKLSNLAAKRSGMPSISPGRCGSRLSSRLSSSQPGPG